MLIDRFRFASTLLLAVAIAVPVAADWPQWRGPDRDGQSPGQAFPADLESLERLWRVELGKGYPGPIVSDEAVFVVESTASEAAAVRALSRGDGSELWRVEWESSGSVPFFAADNGDWVRSTPAFDGERLYVGDMREVLVALDAADGKRLWRIDFAERYGSKRPDFGFASSPLIDDGALYVQAADSVVKIDAASGEILWRVLEREASMMSGGAFSSPILAEIAGRRQLIVQSRLALQGLDPDDGRLLWSREVPNFRGMNILTPVVFDDAVFTSSYRQKAFFYEIERAASGEYSVDLAWSLPAVAYMSSPVVVDGHAYLHLANRRLSCIDLASGEERWRTSESFGKYQSTVARGKRLLALDEKGELILFEANPEAFRLLDRREVADASAWAHLAVDGQAIFVRDLEGITAYRLGARRR